MRLLPAMKMKTFFKIAPLLILLIISSCNQDEKSRLAESNTINGNQISNPIKENQTDLSDSKTRTVLDSLKIDKSIVNKKCFIQACERLFDFSSLQFDFENLTKDFLKSNVVVQQLNGNYLVSIHYGPWSTNGNVIQLFLLDQDLNEVNKGEIDGCHYHNGIIEIFDWDNDGMDEIQFKIDWPTQSIAYIVHLEQVYKFSESNGLKKIFEIERETRDCSPTVGVLGLVIKRIYKFLDDKTLQVTATSFNLNCEDFEWHDEIKNKNKLNSVQYNMKWNKELNKFEKEQAGNNG